MNESSPMLVRRAVRSALALVCAFVVLAVAAPAALAAGTFTGGPIANDMPLYVANDHTVTAMRFAASPSADPSTLQPNTEYYVKVRFSPSPTPQGSNNRGFIWNAASGQWVQERDEWANFPTVTTDADGKITQSPWFFVKFADVTKSGAYYVLVSLSTGASGSTLNGSDAPAVTVLDMRGDLTGAPVRGFWVHNGTATGQSGGKRADAVAGGLGTVWALQRTEPNLCDDDANGAVDDEDYGPTGAAGDFRLAVPVDAGFDVRLQSDVWPSAATSFTGGTADVDIAYGADDQTAPTAPGVLSAEEGAGQVSLQWTPATDDGGSDLSGYVVYRWADPTPIGGATAYTSAPVAIATTDQTSYVDATGTIGTRYSYCVRAVDAATNYGPRSNEVTATPKSESVVMLIPVKAVVGWLGTAALDWSIKDIGGDPIVDAVGHLERSVDKGVTWRTVTDVSGGPYAAGTVVATNDLTRRTWYRLRYDGSGLYAAGMSKNVQIVPRVCLGRPSAPKAVRHGAKFLSSGTMKPRHAGGAWTVHIKCYKRVSGSWKLKKTVHARNVSKPTYTQYRATFALPSAGKWKLVAYHPSDAQHAATTSSARYVTVR